MVFTSLYEYIFYGKTKNTDSARRLGRKTVVPPKFAEKSAFCGTIKGTCLIARKVDTA
jgi:hypothetical protein